MGTLEYIVAIYPDVFAVVTTTSLLISQTLVISLQNVLIVQVATQLITKDVRSKNSSNAR